MLSLLLAAALSSLFSELLVIGAIALVVFIVFKLGKFILKLVFGVITNSILGLVVFFITNTFFGLGIPVTLPILLATALFGLPGIGTIIILKLLGALA